MIWWILWLFLGIMGFVLYIRFKWINHIVNLIIIYSIQGIGYFLGGIMGLFQIIDDSRQGKAIGKVGSAVKQQNGNGQKPPKSPEFDVEAFEKATPAEKAEMLKGQNIKVANSSMN